MMTGKDGADNGFEVSIKPICQKMLRSGIECCLTYKARKRRNWKLGGVIPVKRRIKNQEPWHRNSHTQDTSHTNRYTFQSLERRYLINFKLE